MMIYKKSYVMLHLKAEWPSKQNILIADTILAEPGRNQVLRFGEAKYIFRGEDFNFYHMFKTNHSEHNKIWRGYKKDLRVTASECPPRAWEEPSPENLSLGAFMFVQGG